MATIIISILWALMGLLCIVQNQDQIEKMTIGKALITFFIFMMFGPCFVAVNVIEVILGWLGWEDEDDDGFGV